ncbi:MAG: type VI secretion system baseplate subunit TssF [Desulfosarcina sp.]|nr:type VI secretion system baseplate subunit TssF [Desulfobacterales bacterium]
MKIDKNLYKIFLEEMESLENFRVAFASLHPGATLDQEDPDVKRLIEAMSLLSARTRLAGLKNISAIHRRIFQQFFSYLLTPLPSMAILQALPTGHLADTLFFPRGSEIAVSPESGGTAILRTLHDLRILPISMIKTEMLLLPNKGFRLCLHFASAFERNEKIGNLKFFITHLNNYEASLRVLFNLKYHLKKASVVFDKKVTETTSGIPCGASFGIPPGDEDDDLVHPLQKERLFFHFPWQELFFNVQVPDPEANWNYFTICLDLDESWPKNLVLNQDMFQLFATPIINLRQAMAQPFICNGTKEHYSIRHPEMEHGFELHSVRGVYEVTKEGMSPIKPGILSMSAPSYEIEEIINSERRNSQSLNLHFPQAFLEPKTIAIDAFWFQPWFTETLSQKQAVTPFSRGSVGLKWELLVNLVSHTENFFHDNIDGFLHFIDLTNRSALNRNDLMDILQAIGVMQQAQFKQLCELLVDVRIEKVLKRSKGMSGMLKHRYVLCFQEYDSALQPLMETFLTHMENILTAWLSDVNIEVVKEILGKDSSKRQEIK